MRLATVMRLVIEPMRECRRERLRDRFRCGDAPVRDRTFERRLIEFRYVPHDPRVFGFTHLTKRLQFLRPSVQPEPAKTRTFVDWVVGAFADRPRAKSR